jgi:hypothetical protein
MNMDPHARVEFADTGSRHTADIHTVASVQACEPCRHDGRAATLEKRTRSHAAA